MGGNKWKIGSDEAKGLVGRTGRFYALEEGQFAVELADRVISLVLAHWHSEAGTCAAFRAKIDKHVTILKQPFLYLVLLLRSSRGVETQNARKHVSVGILLCHDFASTRSELQGVHKMPIPRNELIVSPKSHVSYSLRKASTRQCAEQQIALCVLVSSLRSRSPNTVFSPMMLISIIFLAENPGA